MLTVCIILSFIVVILVPVIVVNYAKSDKVFSEIK